MRFLFLLTVFVSIFVQSSSSYAQALPVNLLVNRSIAGTIQKAVLRRGFAMNDPIYGRTMSQISSVATKANVPSSSGLGAVSSPSWMNILFAVGALSNGAALTSDATSIQANGGVLHVSSNPTPLPPVGGIASAQSPHDLYAQRGFDEYRTSSCTGDRACYQYPPIPAAGAPVRVDLNNGSLFGPTAFLFNSIEELGRRWAPGNKVPGQSYTNGIYQQVTSWDVPPYLVFSDNGSIRVAGRYTNQILSVEPYSDGTPREIPPPLKYDLVNDQAGIWVSTAFYKQFTSFDQAIQNLQNDSSRVTDSAMAQVVNSTWSQAASQPGYDGIPYSPVSPSDVSAFRNASGEHPAIQDFLRNAQVVSSTSATSFVPISETATVPSFDPAPSPNPYPNPSPNPGTDTGTNPSPSPGTIYDVNVVNRVAVDLGPDPNIGAPVLEPTPTPYEVLDPILNMLPSFKNFSLPAHDSVCPVRSFNAFGSEIVIDSHCALIDQNRNYIHLAMMVFFSMTSVIIVLRA